MIQKSVNQGRSRVAASLRSNSVATAGALIGVSAIIAAMDAVIVRVLAPEIHVFQIAFFRNFFALLVLLPVLGRRAGLSVSSPYWRTHLLRAAIKLLAMVAYFLALLELPLAVAMALAFTTPLFASAGGILFLKEKATAGRVLSLFAGLLGVVVVLQPGSAPVDAGAVLALASAAGLGAVALLMKVSASREEASRIVWLNLIFAVPMGLLLAAPVWTTPDHSTLALLAVQGVLGAIAQLAVARAMGMADAAAIVPVDFIRLPVVIALGAIFFAEVPEWSVYVGSAIILASILIHLRAERSRSLQDLQHDRKRETH